MAAQDAFVAMDKLPGELFLRGDIFRDVFAFVTGLLAMQK
jgi:hypothetical protein